MGNCLLLQEKNAIKVVKSDGKILQFQPPIRAEQVLSQFSGHGLSESVTKFANLRPEAKLITGRLYYLTPLPLPLPLPLPSPPLNKVKKKVRFVDEVVDGKKGEKTTFSPEHPSHTAEISNQNPKLVDEQAVKAKTTGVVRIKLVVTKQELQEMLLKGGLSVQEVVSRIGSEKCKDHVSNYCRERKAVLESIPEV